MIFGLFDKKKVPTFGYIFLLQPEFLFIFFKVFEASTSVCLAPSKCAGTLGTDKALPALSFSVSFPMKYGHVSFKYVMSEIR